MRLPKTPVSRHLYAHASSSLNSTPCSSPAAIVNIVSSPGPMHPSAEEEEEDFEELPFTLPPGPYSTGKPDFSYAALIGQAILSSPEHRLTLQDIYEWITTVYPYYNRGEQTWMNSVRHSLSTMAVFRKVPRGRNEGKSLWAIWDCDLPCFDNGGFRKNLCADMAKPKSSAPKTGPKRKVPVMDDIARDSKRRKKTGLYNEVEATEPPTASRSTAPTTLPPFAAPILPPFYAPVYPNAQQQPYYANYVPQPVPAEVIFPPLPPQSAYQRIAASRAPSAEPGSDELSVPSSLSSAMAPSTGPSAPQPEVYTEHYARAQGISKSPHDPSSSSSSSQSLPGLTPNCSSSAPSSPPLSSEPNFTDIDGVSEPGLSTSTDPATDVPSDSEDEVDKLTRQWLASPSTIDAFAGPSPKLTPEGSAGSTSRVCISGLCLFLHLLTSTFLLFSSPSSYGWHIQYHQRPSVDPANEGLPEPNILLVRSGRCSRLQQMMRCHLSLPQCKRGLSLLLVETPVARALARAFNCLPRKRLSPIAVCT